MNLRRCVSILASSLVSILFWMTTAFSMMAFSSQAHAQVNGATFVSQSVPTTMIAGQSYSVSVVMKNSGTTTWTSATSYKLGSYNPQNNTTWGAGRVELANSVAPGQQTTFTFNVTAPSTAGTYNFQWGMLREGVQWFGATSTNVAVVVSAPQINNATFVSQSVPTSMTAGQSYSVSVVMKNSGTTTWTSGTSYKLGSQNPQDNRTWNSTARVELTTSVAPGQQATFTFNVTAPSTAGTYNFQWRMIREGVEWFGPTSTNVAVVVSAAQVNNATFVSQSVPTSMTAGQSYSVSVTMQNSGTTTWTAANAYKLSSQNPQDNKTWNSTGRVEMPASVAPGQQTTFTFNVTAPSTAGTYNFQWKMTKEGVGVFGATSTNVAVVVSAAQVNNATFVSQSVPTSMTAGQSYSVSVTMQNSGTTTWTSANAYKLSSQNPQDNKTWNSTGRVEMPASVAPGQQATFTFNVTAPSTAGTYNFQWKMIREGVEWFGATSTNVAVTVAGAPVVAQPISAPSSSVTRTSAFEYDATTGLLTKEIVEPNNTQFRLETAYTYDAYGNKTVASVSSPATGTSAIVARSTSTAYDARGQFAVSSTNALSQAETKVMDPKFGGLTSLTGPNGLTTQWQYDSFGRKTREIRADGTQTKWEYLYCSGINGGTASCPSLAKYLIQTTPLASDGTTANGAWSKAYFDMLDRQIKSETIGFDGSTVIAQSTEYDSLGRVSRSSRPYYSNQTPQWTTPTYDALNRVVVTTAPDNTQTSFSYNGLTTSVTNALGQTQTKLTNSQGQLVKVTDAASGVITYAYDALGNLWKTTDPKGNIVTLAYDLRGRKTQMADPDMGGWVYTYNVLGELVKQTDAKGQSSTMTYDKLGRMTNRSEPDLVSNWTYDTCTKGIGKLCSASADNGYSRVQSYDSLGRANSTSTTIDTTYVASLTFDSNGRVATRTYPNGVVIKYVYTTLGYLSQIRNNSSNALYWSAGSMDAEGRMLQQTYGNNILTQQVFEASTGRLKNIYAGAGNSVQNLSYNYDNIGGLQSRNDANQNLSETFLYDSLNRLTSATVNSGGAGLVTQTYAYDNIGNMTNRSGVGAYSYGAANSRPHGVASITLSGGGQRKYTYDANGNLTSEVQSDASNNVIAAKGRTETYTSFNMPKTIVTPSSTLTFAYDSEHQRSKQIAASATTIYLHPDNTGGMLYEKDIKSDGSIEHRNFLTAGSQVFGVMKQIGSTTTVNYFHRDNMGSTSAVSNEAGTVIERLAYEPFGKRRFPVGSTDTNNTVVGVNTNRGYTNHEHLDTVGLIHMNGRVYDPVIGRFTSADPIIQAADNLQSYNRYAYVINNPLMYTDPSGYLFGGLFNVPFFDNAWNNHIKPNGAAILSIAAAAVCTAYFGPAGGAACMGASQAGISKGYGASWNQAVRSGAISAGTAYAFTMVGDAYPGYGQDGATSGSIFRNTIGHAAVGCASAAAGGGSCGSGALAGGFSAAYGNYIHYSGNTVFATIQSSIVGGTASVLGGGKFENGAITGAFGYLFNECLHTQGCGIGGKNNPSDVSFLKRMTNRIVDFVSQDGTVQLGVGGQVGGWVIGGATEIGIAIPTKLDDICIYAQACSVAGPQLVLSASGAVSLGQGVPSTGTQGSRGGTWFGGTGTFGSAQLTVNSSGQVQGTRGVVRGGVGAGAGAGYIECGQATMCMRR